MLVDVSGPDHLIPPQRVGSGQRLSSLETDRVGFIPEP